MSEDEWVDVSEAPLLADVTWLHSQNGPQPETDSWTPRNLADMEDTPPVQPTLGALGLVYPGKRHVFSGPQESAKTLAAYVIGLQVVRAGSTVVLIDFEMGPWDAKARLRELGASDEDLAGYLYVEPDTPASPSSVAALVEQQPALAIVDAAAGAFDLEGYDDNSRKDVEKWATKWVIPFWKAGIATIVLDHVTKNAETRGKYAIGSERKVGGADVHLGFEVVTPIKRGGHGLYKVVTHKDRGGYLKRGKLAEFELSSDPDTHLITWAFKAPVETDEEHAFRPTHLMEKVSRYLENLSEPVTQNTVEKDIGGKATYLRQAILILVDEGYVEVSEGPNRSKQIASLDLYRETFDSASQVRPEYVPDPEESGASVRPTPYRGDVRDGLTPRDELGASQSPLTDDDGIPF